MAQTDHIFFATYARLDKTCGDRSSTIKGEAYAVGAELAFSTDSYVSERGKDYPIGIVSSAGGEVAGFLPANQVTRYCRLAEKGWTIRVICSAVGYNSDVSYWLEVALIACEPQHAAALEPFVKGVAERIGKGERPDIRLNPKLIDEALEDPALYTRLKKTPYPKLPKGEVYYKKERTATEAMIVAGANNNPGCWAGTVLFYVGAIAIVAAFVWFLFFR